jgi:hypothetical protein
MGRNYNGDNQKTADSGDIDTDNYMEQNIIA